MAGDADISSITQDPIALAKTTSVVQYPAFPMAVGSHSISIETDVQASAISQKCLIHLAFEKGLHMHSSTRNVSFADSEIDSRG